MKLLPIGIRVVDTGPGLANTALPEYLYGLLKPRLQGSISLVRICCGACGRHVGPVVDASKLGEAFWGLPRWPVGSR
ncbi:MAG: hypothetical protein OHK0015_52620 [Chloroflexi bacterium OHK40]